jgi:hypothetical protein
MPQQSECENRDCDQRKAKRLLPVCIHCHGIHFNHQLCSRAQIVCRDLQFLVADLSIKIGS